MRSRFTGALVALLAAVAVTAPAWAQEQPRGVQDVYKDYRDDGVIEACDHTQRALQRTLDDLPPEADGETPDLRPALEAAIEQHESDDCDEPEPTPTPTPTPTSTPAPTSTPVPTAPSTPTTPDTPTDDDSFGTVTPPGGGGSGGGSDPLTPEDIAPLDPEVTPVPPAQTPPTAAPPPAEPSGPAATPAPVYSNPDDGVPVSLLVLAGLLALLALLVLAYAALSRLGWADARLAGVRRAGREARYRAGGTWGDFADWMRVGR